MGCGASAPSAELPKEYRHRATRIEHAELRGLGLVQLLKLGKFVKELLIDQGIKDVDPLSPTHGQLLTWDRITTNQVLSHFVIPWTKAHHCSFAELVLTKGETPPQWCVVHWYGQPFSEVLQQLTHHAKSRQLDIKTPYWLCAFSMNQHVHKDDKSRPDAAANENSPLCKALRHSECQGSIVLVDEECVALRRFWCLWEVFLLQSQGKGKSHDIVGWIGNGRQRKTARKSGQYVEAGPVLLQHVDTMCHLTIPLPEEGRFPLRAALMGATSEMEKGACWNEKARSNLLQWLAKEQKMKNVDRSIQRLFWGLAVCEATNSGDPDCLQKLLALSNAHEDQGHAVDSAVTGQGEFATHIAAGCKQGKCLRMLLENRASTDLRRKNDGSSALHIAAWAQCGVSVKALLEFRAQPNDARHTDGALPAHAAAEQGQTRILEMLIQYGADISRPRQQDGACVVHLAASSGDRECLQYVLDKEADPNCQIQDDDGPYPQATPLLLALLSKKDVLLCVQALLASRADPTITDLQRRTPVLLASAHEDQPSLKALLEARADPNMGRREDGATAVAAVAEMGNTECLKLLLAHKANADSPRRDGLTPVHLACQADAPECLRLLHGAKADLNRQMPGHGMPLDFAEANQFAGVAAVLRGFGAHGVKFDTTRVQKNEGIILKIVGARELRISDVSGLSDPYCIVEAQISTLSEQTARPKFQTPIIEGTTDPDWNYECRIPQFREADILKFTVWDKDKLKIDDNLGMAVLPGKKIWPRGFTGDLSLSRAKGIRGAKTRLLVEVRCLDGGSTSVSTAVSSLRAAGSTASKSRHPSPAVMDC